jgi:hypothetical protein
MRGIMSFSEQKDLEELIHRMRDVLDKPAISAGDPQRLLKEVANALENLNRRVARLEDGSEEGRRATMGLR